MRTSQSGVLDHADCLSGVGPKSIEKAAPDNLRITLRNDALVETCVCPSSAPITAIISRPVLVVLSAHGLLDETNSSKVEWAKRSIRITVTPRSRGRWHSGPDTRPTPIDGHYSSPFGFKHLTIY